MEKQNSLQKKVVFIDRMWVDPESKGFPKDPLERCQKLWSNLFSGVLGCLSKKDPALVRGLEIALEREGLDLNMLMLGFAQHPSDEILERSKSFRENGTIPTLRRGKGQKAASPFATYSRCFELFLHLKDLPKRPRNPDHKYLLLKERLENYIKKHPRCLTISDSELRLLCKVPQKPWKLTVDLIAKLYGESQANIDKLLDKFREENRHFPDHLKNKIDVLYRINLPAI